MLPPRPRIVYLHGFASSPFSRKAQFFAKELSDLGVQLEVPDLAENDFAHLTITGQLRVIQDLVGKDPVFLIGSSLEVIWPPCTRHSIPTYRAWSCLHRHSISTSFGSIG